MDHPGNQDKGCFPFNEHETSCSSSRSLNAPGPPGPFAHLSVSLLHLAPSPLCLGLQGEAGFPGYDGLPGVVGYPGNEGHQGSAGEKVLA